MSYIFTHKSRKNPKKLGMSLPPGNYRLHSHPSVQHASAYVTHNCDCVERNGKNGEKRPKKQIGNNNLLIEKRSNGNE
jgi:hypothetical protein